LLAVAAAIIAWLGSESDESRQPLEEDKPTVNAAVAQTNELPIGSILVERLPVSCFLSEHMTGPPRSTTSGGSLGASQPHLLTSSSSSRPPSQVYTRGTTGAVKTSRSHEQQRQSNNNSRGHGNNFSTSRSVSSQSTHSGAWKPSQSKASSDAASTELAKLHVKVARRVVEGT